MKFPARSLLNFARPFTSPGDSFYLSGSQDAQRERWTRDRLG